jgi:hypothetical protein
MSALAAMTLVYDGPPPAGVFGPRPIVSFLWMVGTIQQHPLIPYPGATDRHCHDVAMRMYLLADALAPKHWLTELSPS